MESILNFFESQTSPILQALYAGLFTWILTAFGAVLVFFFQSSNRKLLDAALGFTGGVMIAASFWSLLSPAIEETLDNLEIRWKKGVFYKTVISDLSDLKNVFYDILVFFSPSGIESLFKNFPDFKQNDTIIAAFGKNTVKAAEEKGLKINIEAPRKRVSSMSRALEIFIEDY